VILGPRPVPPVDPQPSLFEMAPEEPTPQVKASAPAVPVVKEPEPEPVPTPVEAAPVPETVVPEEDDLLLPAPKRRVAPVAAAVAPPPPPSPVKPVVPQIPELIEMSGERFKKEVRVLLGTGPNTIRVLYRGVEMKIPNVRATEIPPQFLKNPPLKESA
jgi:hypothetical protein